jgi:hypothetical protein
MRVGGVKTIAFLLLALIAVVGTVAAQEVQPQALKSDAPKQPYTVNGLVLGARVQSGSAAYRAYDCSRSEQFKGFTWCHRASTEKISGKKSAKKSDGKINSSYSILHSGDGAIVYVNQSSEPSSFTSKEVKEELQRLAQRYGAQPRIINMPRRPEFAEGLIATWGDVVLEPLDASGISQLAAGKSPNKGLLIDFIGNLRRSAQVGLPVYRLAGGAGFVWGASFGKKGGGALRSAAVDASAFSRPLPATSATPSPAPADSPAPGPVAAAPAAPAPAAAAYPAPSPAPAAGPTPGPVPATPSASSPALGVSAAPGSAPAASPTIRPAPAAPPATAAPPTSAASAAPAPAAAVSPAPAPSAAQPPSQATDRGNARETNLADLNQTIETLKADLASSAGKIAGLETAKEQAGRALRQAEQAQLAAENAKDQIERASIAERKALDAKSRSFEFLAYAAAAGLAVVLGINAFVLLMRPKRASLAADEDVRSQLEPLEPAAEEAIKMEETQTQHRGDLVSDNIFGRELEKHVANINALQHETQT